jgi:hypothetical protein
MTDDPFPYRDRIIDMWRAYLPGAPEGRLEWLQRGNPAGPAVWFLAFEEGSDEIAGTLTLLPRKLYLRGEPLLAGTLGDFMVAGKYRVFGPNLQLMRKTLASLDELGMSFIYTVPNDSSRMVAKRAGVRYDTELECYARPIDMSFYLRKYMPAPVAAMLAPPADLLFRLSSREIRRVPGAEVEETDEIGDPFDRIWDRLREERTDLIGERSAAYMRWKYHGNPLRDFRILTCRMRGREELSGYAVFSVRDRIKVDVYDFQAFGGACRDALIKKLISLARSEGRQAVYYIAPGWSPMFDELRRFRFLDVRDTLLLGFFGEPGIPLDEWEFTTSDRNV